MPFRVAPTISQVRGLYVDHFSRTSSEIIGSTTLQNTLLQFCVTHSINYLALFDLDYSANNWGSQLRAFNTKARTSGVTTIAAALPTNPSLVQKVITFNNGCSNRNQMIDRFTIEHEWWNGDITLSAFKSNLRSMNTALHAASPQILIDLYIGWPLTGEMSGIVQYIDRLLIHDYVNGGPSFNYTRRSTGKDRLYEIAAHCASINKILDVCPIASAEAVFSKNWFRTHSLEDFYYGWAVPTLSTSNSSFNYESNSNIRTYMNPTGYMIFSYSRILLSNPPAPNVVYTGSTSGSSSGMTAVTCFSTIHASGPTTFTSGNSVVLTVDGQGIVSGTTTVPQFDHIVVVWGENESRNFVNNTNCPWIHSLADVGADMTGSLGLSHPSQPNYLQFASGSNQGVTNNNPVPGTPLGTQNLCGELYSIGKSGVVYSEGLPSVGYLGANANAGGGAIYSKKHNLVAAWQSNNPTGWQVPPSKNQPFTTFAAISNYDNLPDFSFIAPDSIHNGHDVSDNNTAAATYDTWLSTHLENYRIYCNDHSNNSLLIVSFDESEQSNPANPIRTIIYGAHVRPGVYTTPINHYHILRTIEDGLGLDTYHFHAGAAASVSPIVNIFSGITTGQSSTYVWYRNGISMGQTSGSITVSQAGSYYCRVADSTGCTSNSNTINASVLTPASSAYTSYISASGPLTFQCGSGNVILSALTTPASATTTPWSAGTGYLWSHNSSANTQSITVTGSGCYSCIVFSQGFSARTNTVYVQCFTGNTGFTASISPIGPINFQVGQGQQLCITTSPVSAATSGGTYLWMPGSATTSCISATTSGSYYGIVRDSSGNTAMTNTVIVNAFSGSTGTTGYTGFTAVIVPNGLLTFVASSGGSVILSAITSPTSGGSTYSWSGPSPYNGITTSAITVTVTGFYYCNVYDIYGNLVQTNTVYVDANYVPFTAEIVPDGPLQFQISSDVQLCAVTNPVSAGASYYWYPSGETTQCITTNTTGNYYAIVTDASGTTAMTNTVYVNADYIPTNANYTETIINSSLYFSAYTGSTRLVNNWVPIYIHLTNTADTVYYCFMKMRSRTGVPTSIRVSVDGGLNTGGLNFVPTPIIIDTTYQWYRLGAFTYGVKQIMNDPTVILNFQGLNSYVDMSYFAFSSDQNFVAGPYPITTP